MLAQGLHHFVAVGGAHLQHGAQFFVEQRLQRQLFAAAADLLAQFLASPLSMRLSLMPSPSVTSMSTFSATPTWPAKAISATASRPPSPVVVGQDLALGAQRVHGVHQVDQVLGLVQSGTSSPTGSAPGQDGAAHAVLAAPRSISTRVVSSSWRRAGA
jgi:hypothetical protein